LNEQYGLELQESVTSAREDGKMQRKRATRINARKLFLMLNAGSPVAFAISLREKWRDEAL
jgi:hypothetical protein